MKDAIRVLEWPVQPVQGAQQDGGWNEQPEVAGTLLYQFA
jgi:hypothetical protein